MAEAVVRIKLLGSAAIKELQGSAKRTLGDVGAAEKKAAAESEKLAKKTADAKAKEAERAAKAAIKSAADADKAAKKAADLQAKAADKRSAEQIKAAQREADAKAKASEEAANAAKRAAAAEAKEADKLTAHWQKLALEGQLARVKAEEEVTKAAAREAAKQAKLAEQTAAKRQKEAIGTLRKAGGLVGSATAGVLAGAVAAGGVARNVAGVDDVQSRIKKANDFRERLIVTAGQAGLDDAGTAHAQQTVQRASMASGKDANELVGVLETGQAKFNDLKFFEDNLEGLAVMAKATGSDTVALAEAVGFLKQAFGLSGKEAMESANLMVAAASKGSIEAKDFATDFASVAGIFAEGTGMKGIGGVREFLGVAQAGGTLGKGSAETATMMERFIALLQDPDKMADLRAATGISVKGKTPTQVIEALATSKRFNAPGVQETLFGGDIRASQMITALTSARDRTAAGLPGAIDIKSISGVDSAEGANQVADIMKRMESSGLLDLQRQALEMQNDTITHLKEYNDQIVAVTKVTNSLEKSFGTLGLWASSIGIGGAVTGGTMLLGKMAGGGAGGAAAAGLGAAGGAGLLATLGTGVGAVGAGALGLGVGAAAALGGGVGYGIDKGTEWLTGRSLSDRAAVDWFGGDIERSRSFEPGTEPKQAEVDMRVEVHQYDHRTEVKHVAKGRGATVSTSAGPNMPGAGL